MFEGIVCFELTVPFNVSARGRGGHHHFWNCAALLDPQEVRRFPSSPSQSRGDSKMIGSKDAAHRTISNHARRLDREVPLFGKDMVYDARRVTLGHVKRG